MSFDTTISLLQSYMVNNTIPDDKFNTLFTVLENNADGNCLFESVEQLVGINNISTAAKSTAANLRKQVCDYYKSFDKEKIYDEDSLEGKLKIQMSVDNAEFHARTGKELKRLHEKRICVSKEYAGMMDIMVIAMILRSNIVLLIANEHDFTVHPIKFANDAPIMFIKFNGEDHYEALIPNNEALIPNSSGHGGSMRKHRSLSRSRSSRHGRSSSTKKHRSLSRSRSSRHGRSSSTKKHRSLSRSRSSRHGRSSSTKKQ